MLAPTGEPVLLGLRARGGTVPPTRRCHEAGAVFASHHHGKQCRRWRVLPGDGGARRTHCQVPPSMPRALPLFSPRPAKPLQRLPLSRPSRSHGASADARPRAPGHWFLAPEPARRASWRCAPVHLNQTRHSRPSNLHLFPPLPSSHALSAATRSASSRRAVPQPPPRVRRQAGDSLESVDGVSVCGANLSGLAQLLLGPAGSSVELRLVAAKTGAPPAR